MVRKVCNQDFYDNVFSDEEKNRLISKEIKEAGFGSLCRDKVFLLSEREVRLFLLGVMERIYLS